MATETFTLFPSLPTELQLQIWHLAALPHHSLPWEPNDPRYFSGPHCAISAFLLEVCQRRNFYGLGQQQEALKTVCIARSSMIMTCSMARLIALKAWKVELGAGEMMFWSRWGSFAFRGCLTVGEDEKDIMLEHVEGLIE